MKWTEKKQQPHGIYAYKSVLFILCVDFERNLVCFMNSFFFHRVVFKWKFTVPASYTIQWLTWYFYLPFHFCRYYLLIFFSPHIFDWKQSMNFFLHFFLNFFHNFFFIIFFSQLKCKFANQNKRNTIQSVKKKYFPIANPVDWIRCIMHKN